VTPADTYTLNIHGHTPHKILIICILKIRRFNLSSFILTYFIHSFIEKTFIWWLRLNQKKKLTLVLRHSLWTEERYWNVLRRTLWRARSAYLCPQICLMHLGRFLISADRWLHIHYHCYYLCHLEHLRHAKFTPLIKWTSCWTPKHTR